MNVDSADDGPTLNLSVCKIFALLALQHSLYIDRMELCCFLFGEKVTKEPDISHQVWEVTGQRRNVPIVHYIPTEYCS